MTSKRRENINLVSFMSFFLNHYYYCHYHCHYYYYFVEFSSGFFPGKKYSVKSYPETRDFQHFSEEMC